MERAAMAGDPCGLAPDNKGPSFPDLPERRDQKLVARFFVLCVAFCLGQPVLAAECPDFFRFVDFGQPDVNGLSRGGTLIRVESLEGRPLLKRAETTCSGAQFLASDGHGNPIPVVTSVRFDAGKLPFDVSGLTLNRVEDAIELAKNTAKAHSDTAVRSTTQTVRGDSHLCVGSLEALSCQVVSPFVQNAPLVVYCDEANCEMPSFAFNDHIVVGATWPMVSNDLDRIGREIVKKVQDISTFLETQH